jgi:hypothetical protein
MKSKDSNLILDPIPFPTSNRVKTTPPTEADLSAARTHDIEIYELCRETSLALQELRHGVAHVLHDTIEKMSLDTWTLAQILDERPSVVRDLIEGETDDLTTETMIKYLEKLRPQICSV